MDEVGDVMKIHHKHLNIGYRFSTAQKNDSISNIKNTESLTWMFQDAVPLALSAQKHHAKPFIVEIFEVLTKSKGSGTKLVHAKGKQVIHFPIYFFVYFTSHTQASKQSESIASVAKGGGEGPGAGQT